LLFQRRKKIDDEAPADFERSFKRLLETFSDIPAEEKSTKIRKVARTLSPTETESLIQLVDLVGSEGLQREPLDSSDEFDSHIHKSSCDCTNCHYKDELLRIDDFYKDFLGAI